ncbi:MAG: protein kinase family protein [Chlamydiales bacterium]|nr:protein kinase family protein [Chlamydiales bacterium]
MTTPSPLKRKSSQEILVFQDENKRLKTDVTECSQQVAKLIINDLMQKYLTPTVQSLLSESQHRDIGSVIFDKANGIVSIKLNDTDLCIASKVIGTGYNNTARKAAIINLSTFEISENFKLKHTNIPEGKRPPRIERNSPSAHKILEALEHEHITPTPIFFDIIPTQFAMPKPIKIQYCIEPFFEHISSKYKFSSAGEIQSFTQQIASALKYLHKQNIIHGDLRSDNIAIDNGKAILIDWDTMRKVDPNQASSSSFEDFEDSDANSFNTKDGRAILLDSIASETIQFGHVIHNWLYAYLIKGDVDPYSYIEQNQIKGVHDKDLCMGLFNAGQRLINGESLDDVFPCATPTDLKA